MSPHSSARRQPHGPGGAPEPGPPTSAPSRLAVAGASVTLTWTVLRRGRRPVLAPGQVVIPTGSTVGLVGANGAGKSTLLMALAGVLAGRCGSAVAVSAGAELPSVGYLPQRPSTPAWLDVRSALGLLGLDAAAVSTGTPLAGLLAPLLHRRADALSGGQSQLVAVAGILARRDPLLLLDEPFAGVDVRHREALVAGVGEHRSRSPDSVLLLASHLTGDIFALCDWLLVLRDGGLVFEGPTTGLVGEGCGDRSGCGPMGVHSNLHGVAVLEHRLSELLH